MIKTLLCKLFGWRQKWGGVIIDYLNWKGERRLRKITPIRIFYGKTPYHPQEGWMMDAWDEEKQAMRTFSMACIYKWG